MGKLDGKMISEDYLSGMSSLEIANKYNVSKPAILYHLRKNGTPIRKPKPITNKEEIISLYASGKSTLEIGEMFNATHTRICGILKSSGVIMRTRTEALERYSRKNKCVICGKIFRVKNHWYDTNKF